MDYKTIIQVLAVAIAAVSLADFCVEAYGARFYVGARYKARVSGDRACILMFESSPLFKQEDLQRVSWLRWKLHRIKPYFGDRGNLR
jgi:hypothetical protein